MIGTDTNVVSFKEIFILFFWMGKGQAQAIKFPIYYWGCLLSWGLFPEEWKNSLAGLK